MSTHDVPSNAHNDASVAHVVAPWSFALSALAVFRLTRLATLDDITAGPRDRFIRAVYVSVGRESEALAEIERTTDPAWPNAWTCYAMDDNNPPKLATLASCRWCAGAWISLLAVIAGRVAPRAWRLVSEVFALSALGALIAGLEKD